MLCIRGPFDTLKIIWNVRCFEASLCCLSFDAASPNEIYLQSRESRSKVIFYCRPCETAIKTNQRVSAVITKINKAYLNSWSHNMTGPESYIFSLQWSYFRFLCYWCNEYWLLSGWALLGTKRLRRERRSQRGDLEAALPRDMDDWLKLTIHWKDKRNPSIPLSVLNTVDGGISLTNYGLQTPRTHDPNSGYFWRDKAIHSLNVGYFIWNWLKFAQCTANFRFV